MTNKLRKEDEIETDNRKKAKQKRKVSQSLLFVIKKKSSKRQRKQINIRLINVIKMAAG